MSVLAPLFLLGGLAIALPIVFHLIRRQPQGQVPFSSLIFLEASPPRLSRRSRIDNWLLLLLRGLALVLIATAFARPFLRSSAAEAAAAVEEYRLVLIDRSASMRRGDLWQQAVAAAVAEAENRQPTTRVAWATFDTRVDVLHDFAVYGWGDEGPGVGSAGEGSAGEGSAGEAGELRAALRGIEPTWRASDLGAALIAAADRIDDAARQSDAGDAARTIVVISDMQAGSTLTTLHGYQWPESTRVRLEPLELPPSSNATIAGAEPAAAQDPSRTAAAPSAKNGFRISVSNAADSPAGQFTARWIDAEGAPLGASAASLTVPPGTTRASRLAAPPVAAKAIELVGDDHAFDNRRYVTVPEPLEQSILFLGSEEKDPRESLLYYLQRVSLDRPGNAVTVERREATRPLIPADSKLQLTPTGVPLIVVAAAPSPPQLAELKSYLESGGRILLVVDSAAAEDPAFEQAAQTLSGDDSLQIEAAEVDDYVLLTQIDFQHPLFEPLADPRFSDFAKIQFWAHQKISVDDPDRWRTLARFDDGATAFLERSVGSGKVWVLAAGWQPTESQLALSTKFVPIIAGMARDAQRAELTATATVGEPWTLPASETAEILMPDGRRIAYRTPADAQAIDVPGIYRYRDGADEQAVAVNLAVAESRTEPMDRSMLEQLGVRFTDQQQAERQAQTERQAQDAELERQQSWWRVLLLAGLAMIGLETLLSSRTRSARDRDPAAGVQSPRRPADGSPPTSG